MYKEMQKIETKAYLYDVAGFEEYENEYLEYKELSKRLYDSYGKTIEEVAAFYEDQLNQKKYADAQMEELSLQYKALVAYERSESRSLTKDVSLFDAVGHSRAKREAEYGIYATRLVYVVAEDNADIMLRIMTTPDVVGGKNTVTTTVTILSADGEIIDEISSADMTNREFNKALNELKYQNGLMKCHVFENQDEARKELDWIEKDVEERDVQKASEEEEEIVRRKVR